MKAPSAGAPAPPRRPPQSPRPGPSAAAAALAAALPPGPPGLLQRALQAARELECALPQVLHVLKLLLIPSPALDALALLAAHHQNNTDMELSGHSGGGQALTLQAIAGPRLRTQHMHWHAVP